MATIRRATAADLPAVYDIWHEHASHEEPGQPRRADIAAMFAHERATGAMLVAQEMGQVVGFAAIVPRDAVVFLAELFVRAQNQSRGVGRALLQAILPRDGRTLCAVSSADPRAVALYTSFGMTPRWKSFRLRGATAEIEELPGHDVEVVPADASEPALRQWDAELSGRRRPQDFTFWIEKTKATPVWFRRRGEVIGCGFAQRRNLETLSYPDAISLGPVGVRDAADVVACVSAAVNWAKAQAEVVRITLSELHPSTKRLVKAGFAVVDTETFMCSGTNLPVDPRRYAPSGSCLF